MPGGKRQASPAGRWEVLASGSLRVFTELSLKYLRICIAVPHMWEFQKVDVPYFGALIIKILLLIGYYIRVP